MVAAPGDVLGGGVGELLRGGELASLLKEQGRAGQGRADHRQNGTAQDRTELDRAELNRIAKQS